MINIVICSGVQDTAKKLFEMCREVVDGERLSCHIFWTADSQRVLCHLQDNINLYDIFILDARDKNCLSIAARLRKKNLIAAVIFVSDGSIESLFRIVRYRPSAFVTEKDFDEDFKRSFMWVSREQQSLRWYLTIKNKDTIMRINFEDIICLESRQRLVVLHTSRQTIEFYAKLSDVQRRLPQDRFIRCHQSYIVNMEHVRVLNKADHRFVLDAGDTVGISRSCYGEVVEKYEKFVRNIRK